MVLPLKDSNAYLLEVVENVQVAPTAAGTGVRAIAYILDITLIGITTAVLNFLFLYSYVKLGVHFGLAPLSERNVMHIYFFKQIVGFIVFASYMSLSLWWLDGQTLGKKLLKIRVISEKPDVHWTFMHSLKRAIAYQLSYMLVGFGFALAFFRKDGKTLHDLLCNHKVVEA